MLPSGDVQEEVSGLVIDQAGGQNRLLAGLPADDRARLLSRLEPIQLPNRHILYRPGEPIRQVYFPLSGLVSQIVVMEDGSALETGIVGREGMVGIQAFVGTAVAPNLAMMQTAGEALELSSDGLIEATKASEPLRELLLRYTISILNQTARMAACNRLHPIEKRCARWLLLAQDRSGAEVLPFTQELLSVMLGVRRASITAAAAFLQRAGLIRYTRGSIEILNRAGLEAASCECYDIMRRASEIALD